MKELIKKQRALECEIKDLIGSINKYITLKIQAVKDNEFELAALQRTKEKEYVEVLKQKRLEYVERHEEIKNYKNDVADDYTLHLLYVSCNTIIPDIDNFLQSIETKQAPETKLEPRYELIIDFKSPLKTIKKGTIQTESGWIEIFTYLVKGDCSIKKNWFKEVDSKAVDFDTWIEKEFDYFVYCEYSKDYCICEKLKAKVGKIIKETVITGVECIDYYKFSTIQQLISFYSGKTITTLNGNTITFPNFI